MTDYFSPGDESRDMTDWDLFVCPVAEDAVSGDVEAVFEEIRRQYGFVPNLYRTLANFPPLLRASWEKLKAVMVAGPLRAVEKEAVAVAVSQGNDYEYCVRMHTRMPRQLGVDQEDIDAPLRFEWNRVNFLDEREKALLVFVHKTNGSATRPASSDLEQLRSLGTTNAELLPALATMEIYISYNKLLVALRVATDGDAQLQRLRYSESWVGHKPVYRSDPGAAYIEEKASSRFESPGGH